MHARLHWGSIEQVSVQNDRSDGGDEPPAIIARCGLAERGKVRVLQDIVNRASMMAKTSMSMVSVLDEDTQWFVARTGLEGDQTPRIHSFCRHTVLKPGEPMIVADARHDPRFSDNPLVLGAPYIRFYAGVPLVDSSGYALGALCVADTEPRPDFRQIGQLVELARLAERVICG